MACSSLNYLCIPGVVLPWCVRSLSRLRGCIVPGCAPNGLWSGGISVYLLSLRLYLVGVRLSQVKHALDETKVVCVRCKSKARCNISIYVCRVLRICSPVSGPGCAFLGCAADGTKCVRALRVFADFG